MLDNWKPTLHRNFDNGRYSYLFHLEFSRLHLILQYTTAAKRNVVISLMRVKEISTYIIIIIPTTVRQWFVKLLRVSESLSQRSHFIKRGIHRESRSLSMCNLRTPCKRRLVIKFAIGINNLNWSFPFCHLSVTLIPRAIFLPFNSEHR